MAQSNEPSLRDELPRLLSGEKTIAELAHLNEYEMRSLAAYAHRLFVQGKVRPAKTLFEGLVAIEPRIPQFHASLGEILLRENQLEAALAELDAALKLNPEDPVALAYRSEVLIRQGKLDQAWGELVEVFLRDPDLKTAPGRYAFRLASTLASRVSKTAENQQAIEMIRAKTAEKVDPINDTKLKVNMPPIKPDPDRRGPSGPSDPKSPGKTGKR